MWESDVFCYFCHVLVCWWFGFGFDPYLSVCWQDNSKSYGWIFMKFEEQVDCGPERIGNEPGRILDGYSVSHK